MGATSPAKTCLGRWNQNLGGKVTLNGCPRNPGREDCCKNWLSARPSVTVNIFKAVLWQWESLKSLLVRKSFKPRQYQSGQPLKKFQLLDVPFKVGNVVCVEIFKVWTDQRGKRWTNVLGNSSTKYTLIRMIYLRVVL